MKISIFKTFKTMQAYLLIIAATVGTLALPAHAQEEEEGFRNFLVQSMENYPRWVLEKGLDPTPVIKYEVNLTNSVDSLFNITGWARNHIFEGHFDVRTYIKSSNLGSTQFDIGFEVGNYSITGEYSVEGTVHSNHAEGHGQFHISTNTSRGSLWMKRFYVTADGFIDLSAYYSNYEAYLPSPGEDGSHYWFENLDAGGREDFLVTQMYNLYRPAMFYISPFHDYIIRYLKELFDKTPISEIIETTPRPAIIKDIN